MFQLHSWPNVILHLDGDSFFASVAQAINPELKGKPVVTGQERGIAIAVSYEAKKLGIKRGMRIREIKNNFPTCYIVKGDYESYSLFSKKMFSILRTFSPIVEEYSIDEAFADLKGLTGHLTIGQAIKSKIESSLGLTISVGISLTKSLAKLASGYKKPSGLTIIDGPSIEKFLEKILVKDIWGIGKQTSAYLNKLNVFTALEFAQKPEEFVTKYLSKPFFEIWQELRGIPIYTLNTESKNTYKSITRSATFYPPSSNPDILWAKLTSHIEDAFQKSRSFNYQVGKLIIFLKTQDFKYHVFEIKFDTKISYPLLVKDKVKTAFYKIYQPKTLFRTTGCTITDFEDNSNAQSSLFHDNYREEKTKKIYSLYEKKKVNFGNSLFDKKQTIEGKKTKKLNLPFINIASLSY